MASITLDGFVGFVTKDRPDGRTSLHLFVDIDDMRRFLIETGNEWRRGCWFEGGVELHPKTEAGSIVVGLP